MVDWAMARHAAGAVVLAAIGPACGPTPATSADGSGGGDDTSAATAAATEVSATSCGDGCGSDAAADDTTACGAPCEPTDPGEPQCWTFGEGFGYGVTFVDGDMVIAGKVDEMLWVSRVQPDGTLVFTDTRIAIGGAWGAAAVTTTDGRVTVLGGENYDTKFIGDVDVPIPRTWVGAYGPVGQLTWERTFGDGSELHPHSLAAGVDGTVAVLAAYGDPTQQYELTDSTVWILDGTGETVASWTVGSEWVGVAIAASPDPPGRVQVVTSAFELIEYDTLGNEQWRIQLEGAADEEGEALALGPSGTTVVAGSIGDGNSIDAVVHVVEADATVAWTASYGAPGPFEKAWGAAIGSQGEVVLVGTERDSLSDELSPWVRRYDASGNLSWSDVPTAMGVVFGAAVDADGTIATAAVGDDQFRLCRYPG